MDADALPVELDREQANREREQAHREVKRQLAERISLCQRVLRRPVSPADELLDHSAEELREQAERLEREISYLATPNKIRGIADLVGLVV